MGKSTTHPEGVTASRAEAAENNARVAEARFRETVAKAQIRAFKEMHKALGSGGGGGGSRSRHRSEGYLNSYPAVKRNRLRIGGYGRSRGGSADAHLDPRSLDDLRTDCQMLMRSNPAARSIVAKFVELVVGWGPRLVAGARRPGEEDGPDASEAMDSAALKLRTLKQDLWTDYCLNEQFLQKDRCDHRGLSTFSQLLSGWVEAAVVDGDTLILPTDRGSLQTIEGERIVSPGGPGRMNRVDPTAGGWIAGVQVDPEGVPLNYNVCPYGPDGSIVDPTRGRLVRASDAMLFRSLHHLKNTQTRGEPALAATPDKFEDLEQTDYAVRKALWVAACQAVIVKHPNPAAYQSSLPGGTVPRNDGSGLSDEERDIEPGRMNVLPVGAEMSQFSPEHPSLVYEAYVLMQKGQLSADIGVPVLVALMDPRQTNYSGFRAMLALAYVLVYKWQTELERICRRSFRFAMARWIRAGLVPMHEGWDRSTWVWPPMPVLNPKEEAGALEICKRNGFKSDEEIVHELSGRDVCEVYAEQSREKKLRITLGIEPVPAPGASAPAPTAEPEDGADGGDGGGDSAEDGGNGQKDQ